LVTVGVAVLGEQGAWRLLESAETIEIEVEKIVVVQY